MFKSTMPWSALLLAAALNCAAAPAIELTHVPPIGSSEDLRGRVSGAAPADHRVAVFIYVPNAGWWSKPFCSAQLTTIQPDGAWTADITTGGTDPTATRITTLLVRPSFAQPCVEGAAALPENVTAEALASASVTRADPAVRRLSFSGYEWWVKSSSGLVGPGPNYFSDSSSNVWVDAEGQLHLRITNRSNRWHCAEIVSARTFGYGSYRFELASVVNDLNRNAVLGLFTWSDDPAYAHREIDVECSRWGSGTDPSNSQFVVQPWDSPGHLVRYTVPALLSHSTHLFTWESNRITFQAQRGGYSPTPPSTNIIRNWTFTGAVPQSGDENVRLNLWLVNGQPPAGNQEVEFVVRSFRFAPLGPAPRAALRDLRVLDGMHASFNLLGQFDRWHQLQTSTNLADWEDWAFVLATNSLMLFHHHNGAAGAQRFYRAITMP